MSKNNPAPYLKLDGHFISIMYTPSPMTPIGAKVALGNDNQNADKNPVLVPHPNYSS